ncbi:MAG: arsenosugar biosynthesis radical SAM (seleno)protein ArsS [Chthoniobacterales bacterium]
MNRFAQTLHQNDLPLRRAKATILQINVGKLCNLTCTHCHVNAGPKRKEIMTRETGDRIVDWLAETDIPTVDLTGGAPEMIPDFQHVVRRIRGLGRRVIDRCNLTILLEPGYDGMAEFLAENEVEIVASMPCYSPENVNAQRGDGVFDGSIKALQLLNSLGYGTDPKLPLNLVYNPNGDALPGPQEALEADYKRELREHFGIKFNSLYTITNLPVSRFASWLRNNGKYESYLEVLVDAFNPATVEGLMCRDTINVDWQGGIYDCDFNQMLGLQLRGAGAGLNLWDITPDELENRGIATGEHCFGCTAGAGSSCGGSIE